jgi:hypothetical protein
LVKFKYDPLKTQNILLVANRCLNQIIQALNGNGRNIRDKIYFRKFISLEEFKQKWPYNKNAYPYTSLIENYRIGGGPFKLITNY